MHKRHLVLCAAGIMLAIVFIVATGPSTGGLGLLAVALVCPIAMVVAMTFLMGSRHGQPTHLREQVDAAPNRRQLDARHP